MAKVHYFESPEGEAISISAATFSFHYVMLTAVTKPSVLQGPSQASVTSNPIERKLLSKSFFDISATSASTQ